jgi:predicted adenylyl cyclase CyaB
MPTNLELKARYPSSFHAEGIARRLGARFQGILRQKDTYFQIPSGRLKLRETNGRNFELIAYRRPDTRSTRYSDYHIVPIPSPQALKNMFSSLFGTVAIVSKTRHLYCHKNARIHIDTVRSLGTFIEFEVVVKYGKHQARRLMQELTKAFSIQRHSVIGVSYCDLLVQQTHTRR